MGELRGHSDPPVGSPHPNRKMNGGLTTPMVPQSPHLCGQSEGDSQPRLCLERLTRPTGILEGAGSLASLRVGVMQIAEFDFNLFVDEHPSPEGGGGGVQSRFNYLGHH